MISSRLIELPPNVKIKASSGICLLPHRCLVVHHIACRTLLRHGHMAFSQMSCFLAIKG